MTKYWTHNAHDSMYTPTRILGIPDEFIFAEKSLGQHYVCFSFYTKLLCAGSKCQTLTSVLQPISGFCLVRCRAFAHHLLACSCHTTYTVFWDLQSFVHTVCITKYPNNIWFTSKKASLLKAWVEIRLVCFTGNARRLSTGNKISKNYKLVNRISWSESYSCMHIIGWLSVWANRCAGNFFITEFHMTCDCYTLKRLSYSHSRFPVWQSLDSCIFAMAYLISFSDFKMK